MRFRLTTLRYVFALLGAGMATFGAWGILLAALVLLFWAKFPLRWFGIFRRDASPGPIEWLIILFAFVMVTGALSPIMSGLRLLSPSGSQDSANSQLLSLEMALSGVVNQQGKLPEVSSDDSQPLLRTWRLEALRYYDYYDYDQVQAYSQYKQDEPWDSPHNRKLADQFDAEQWLSSDDQAPLDASYFAIVGPETIWSPPYNTDPANPPDGAENTILLIEATGLGIPWMEPRDLSIDKAVELLTSGEHAPPNHHERFCTRSYDLRGGRYVLFADRSVKYLHRLDDPKIARALLTAAGGEELPDDLSKHFVEPETITEIKWRNVYSLALFIALALLPGWGLWRLRNEPLRPSAAHRH